MKTLITTEVFEYNTGMDFLIMAVCRVIGDKCFVSFIYSNDIMPIYDYSDLDGIDFTSLKKWAVKKGATEFISNIDL